MKNKDIIIGIGEILWDVLPTGKVLGGAPANFAYHSGQFGFEGYAISAVGKDELGKEIIENLKRKKLNYILPEIDFPTGTVNITLDENGIPCYEICENVAWDNIPIIPKAEDIARKAKAICFGSLAQRNEISRKSIRHIIRLVPKESLRIFDINLRQHCYTTDTVRESISHCNILKINDEELITVSRMFGYDTPDLQEICKRIVSDFKLEMLILTCGINGSYVFTPTSMSFQTTPQVKVVDTVGAGDSFTAAFCSAIIKGKDICEAHKIAVDTSAYVCSCAGAMPALPEKITKIIS